MFPVLAKLAARGSRELSVVDMNQADFRFHPTFNHFLPPSRREIAFAHFFDGRVSIKDTIESLGVPHTEVDLIVVNDASVDFSYLVQDGDKIIVYPVFAAVEIEPKVHLRSQPPTRFVLDIHLGKLANSLRLLGFDTLYRNDYEDEQLAKISSSEGRILLTRDRGLLKRSLVIHGYSVRETNPQLQIVEVLRRFNLFGAISPFRRCIRCNGTLESVSKEAIIEQLPPQTRQNYDEFSRCQSCNQIFWKGTHYQQMLQFIESVKQG